MNAVTKDVAYPIPHTQDCFHAVAGATLFSMMDIPAAYHQIPVAKEDIAKTAFVTKYGLYEFKTMPFGLKTFGSANLSETSGTGTLRTTVDSMFDLSQ